MRASADGRSHGCLAVQPGAAAVGAEAAALEEEVTPPVENGITG